jgi:stage II sporulation protein D
MNPQATPSHDIEDAEMAAYMAAVYAYIIEEEEQLAKRAAKKKLINPWLAATRLEQTGRAHRVVSSPVGRENLWKALLSLILCLASTMPVFAQDETKGRPDAGAASAALKPIRIGLCVNCASVELGTPDGAEIRDENTGAVLGKIAAGAKKHLNARLAGTIIAPPTDSVFELNGKLYRGLLWVQKSRGTAGGINAINVLNIEDYLLSVLPSEMPSNWPAEALRAQAIAARSYAVANIGKHAADGYDLKPTVEDQVYSGVETETDICNKAVADTAGIVIKHQEKVVPAFFHSSSGGRTELAEYVWQTPVPFLHSVDDYDDNSPHASWTKNVSVNRLEAGLANCGMGVGRLLGTIVVARSPSQRAKTIMVSGTQGTHLISADHFRKALGLPSTNFTIACVGENYIINGRGFGHGLGLSQWGARTLAEQGYNAAQILAYYYKDVSLGYF